MTCANCPLPSQDKSWFFFLKDVIGKKYGTIRDVFVRIIDAQFRWLNKFLAKKIGVGVFFAWNCIFLVVSVYIPTFLRGRAVASHLCLLHVSWLGYARLRIFGHVDVPGIASWLSSSKTLLVAAVSCAVECAPDGHRHLPKLQSIHVNHDHCLVALW